MSVIDKIEAIHPNKGRNRFTKGVWDSGIPAREGWTIVEPEMPESVRAMIEPPTEQVKPKKRKA